MYYNDPRIKSMCIRILIEKFAIKFFPLTSWSTKGKRKFIEKEELKYGKSYIYCESNI